MSQKVMHRPILYIAQLHSYSQSPTLIWACESLRSWSPLPAPLSHLMNLACSSQGQETLLLGVKIHRDIRMGQLTFMRKTVILCSKYSGSLYKGILKKNLAQVFLEIAPYLRFSTSVLYVKAHKQSPRVVYSF